MLKIQNLKAGYNGMEILHDINLEIKPREITAFIGPNGAGKSTLLKSIFNLTTIYQGKILYQEKDITNFPTHLLIQQGISYIPQGRQIFSHMTVKENLEIAGFFLEKAEIAKRIDIVYQQFPFLKEKQHLLVSTLSGGQQQMLVIALSLLQNPQLLLLDEPSLGLSPKITKEVFQKIQEINKKGITVLIVEQNAKQAVSIADRTYILEDGKIAFKGGKEILKDKRIKKIYFGGR